MSILYWHGSFYLLILIHKNGIYKIRNIKAKVVIYIYHSKKRGNTIMLITVVAVVFITLAVVLFSVGNFKCARVLVPIIAVAMSMGI